MKNTLTSPAPVVSFLASDPLIAIPMDGDGVDCLKEQVVLDITAKGLGWRPIPFTLFELLEIEKLLPGETCNRVMFHSQRKLIAQYCAHYYKQARDAEDTKLSRLYDEFLDALLPGTTITFLL